MIKKFNFFLKHFGLMLISIEEISTMESHANSYYSTMKICTSERDKGYFNGLADYASKMEYQLRDKYL